MDCRCRFHLLGAAESSLLDADAMPRLVAVSSRASERDCGWNVIIIIKKHVEGTPRRGGGGVLPRVDGFDEGPRRSSRRFGRAGCACSVCIG